MKNTVYVHVRYNLLVLDKGPQQLRPQSTEAVRKTTRKFFTTLLLLSRYCHASCHCLLTEVSVSWETPEHVQYVEPPISPQ